MKGRNLIRIVLCFTKVRLKYVQLVGYFDILVTRAKSKGYASWSCRKLRENEIMMEERPESQKLR